MTMITTTKTQFHCLCYERLNLTASMMFEDYVSIDDDLQTDEEITEARFMSILTANNDGEQ